MAGRPPQLRWAQVMAWRADRHQLAGRAPSGSMLELAARVAGLHAQVTRRFLAASGPVTREDFARWWGIPSPARVEVEGTAAYLLAADLPVLAGTGTGGPRTVRLLPAFDQYVVTATLQAGHLMPSPFKAFTGGRLELTGDGA